MTGARQTIQANGLNASDVKGKLALKTGKILALITPTTPDEPALVDKMRQAAKEILNVNL